MIRILAFLFLLATGAHAEVIFVDLNDAGEEIRHCQAGLDAKNAKQTWQNPEQLNVVKGTPGDRGDYTKTYHALRAKIQDMIRRGVKIDSIVISGEDGSGHFFGTQGDFHSYELKALMDEFPQVASTLKTAALWGCYPTSVHGAEQFWINKLPNMQLTMGFVVQGPDKTREANHVLLKQFCERREEAAQATTIDQMCKFYDSLQQVAVTSLGLCNRMGVASREYAIGRTGEKCFTYDQMHKRCPSFINNRELQNVYERYMSGDAEPPEESFARISDLRNFYNEVQKWRHCAEQYKTARGSDMPYAPNLIRLIKYQKLKKNMAKLNAPELAEYDRALERAGLGALKLGDITKLSRKSMNQKIEAAVAALQGQTVEVPVTSAPPADVLPRSERACNGNFMFSGCAGDEGSRRSPAPVSNAQSVRGVQDPPLLRMAQCMRQTFVNMDNVCSPFDLVSNHPRTSSMCLKSYAEAKVRFPDDPC